MSRRSTYYDLFGVPPTAALREIREGYIQLMKRHHPDAAQPQAADASDIVATANRCYAVLKDSKRRAAYDRRLSQAERVQQALIAGPRAHRKKASSALVTIALGAGIAVFTAVAIGIVRMGGDLAAFDSLVRPSANDRATHGGVPMPSAAAIGDIVRRANSMRDSRAVTLSRQCYADARAAASEAEAQNCVIFDEAALYSGMIWQDDPLVSSYFNPEVVRVRQSGILAPFDADGHQLEQLRKKALMQVLSEARQGQGGDGGSPLPSTG